MCMLYINEFVILTYSRAGSQEAGLETATVVTADQPAVIPALDSLIGDLLNMDVNAATIPVPAATSVFSPPSVDLLGGGLDSLVSFMFTF